MARTSLLAALPQVFADAHVEGSPLAALVAAADDMQQPVAEVLDHLETAVDPFRSSDAVACYLASWVDLDWLTIAEAERSRCTLPGGVPPLRDLIAAAAELSTRRGTASGMVRFLELATRVNGFAVHDAGGFRLVVDLPAGAEPQREAVARIVAAIKPAHVTATLSALAAPAAPAPEPPAPAAPAPEPPAPAPPVDTEPSSDPPTAPEEPG